MTIYIYTLIQNVHPGSLSGYSLLMDFFYNGYPRSWYICLEMAILMQISHEKSSQYFVSFIKLNRLFCQFLTIHHRILLIVQLDHSQGITQRKWTANQIDRSISFFSSTPTWLAHVDERSLAFVLSFYICFSCQFHPRQTESRYRLFLMRTGYLLFSAVHFMI